MKLVRHPCVVRLYEVKVLFFSSKVYIFASSYGSLIDSLMFQVLASRTKIYIILEYITGGELFDKIVSYLASQLKVNDLWKKTLFLTLFYVAGS